jgi:hypothetical protein
MAMASGTKGTKPLFFVSFVAIRPAEPYTRRVSLKGYLRVSDELVASPSAAASCRALIV